MLVDMGEKEGDTKKVETWLGHKPPDGFLLFLSHVCITVIDYCFCHFCAFLFLGKLILTTSWRWLQNLKQMFWDTFNNETMFRFFQLLARQANSASEANTDKRFFNVRYRKNLDNLCAPPHKTLDFKTCQIHFQKKGSCKRFDLPLVSAPLHFLCNFGNFISGCWRCDGPAGFKRGLSAAFSLTYDPQQRTSQQNSLKIHLFLAMIERF